MLGSKVSNAPKNNRFPASFMHLKLKRKPKKDYRKVGKSKAGTGLQDI